MLHSAAINGQAEIVRELLARGASVDLANEQGSTPLMAATQVGSLELMRLLLDHSADPNRPTADGVNALMTAAEHNRSEALSLLLEHGAQTDLVTAEGETALMRAAGNGAERCVAALLGAGADAGLVSGYGKTALALAEESGHASTQLRLQRHDASSTGEDGKEPASPPLLPDQLRLDVGGGRRVTVAQGVVRSAADRRRDSGLRRALFARDA